METKLTLKLNSVVIERAKKYAKDKNTSLSKLIENYLGFLIEPNDDNEVTPLVKSLSGIIDLPGDYDYKNNYKNHLLKKYTE